VLARSQLRWHFAVKFPVAVPAALAPYIHARLACILTRLVLHLELPDNRHDFGSELLHFREEADYNGLVVPVFSIKRFIQVSGPVIKFQTPTQSNCVWSCQL
jgi:hypothetical protein